MKKIVTIIVMALVCIMGLTACGGASTVNSVSITGKQSLEYAVVGNGGSAVQYGNYLYFINGTRGYDDTEGKNNVAGKVIKGALYRAELTGDTVAVEGQTAVEGKTSNASKFVIARDAESGIKLVSEKGTSYNNKEINVVDVQLISSKTIGTSGYADGGLYIFNEYVYFASPCATRNKDGVVMANHNEFYRTNLITGVTQKLLTSETANNSKAYGFYYYNGNVYLTYVETGDSDYIVSALINESTGAIDSKMKIAEDVTTVIMPTNDTYYYGMENDTVYDFIYYGTSGSSIESYRTDSLMSFIRPDGTEKTIFNSGSDATLLDVKGGMLLYTITSDDGMKSIRATDMYKYFLSGSDSFKALHGEEKYEGAFMQDKIVLTGAMVGSATATECFVPGIGVDTNAVYVLLTSANATTSSNNDLTLYAPDGSITVLASGEAAKYVNNTTDKMIYSVTNNSSLEVYSVGFDGNGAQMISANVTEATLMSDVAADYFIFFGQVDDTYSGYTLFYDLAGLEGKNEPFFVGVKTEAETRSNVGSIELDTVKAKLVYAVGESIDVSGLTLTAYTYADKDGEKSVIDENVAVTADMVSGFDTTAVSDAITLTVNYKGVTATYEVSVVEQRAGSSCGSIDMTSTLIFGLIAVVGMGAVMLLFGKKKNA